MIRGAVYTIDLGDTKRGHEQRGRRYGVVLSPSRMNRTMATVVPVVPTSTSAQPAKFRPELEVAGRTTRFLADQIRSIDTASILGDPVDVLGHDELAEVERAVAHYLEL
ncbi:type II toxin-antitoxin system PemK/MazF family toxin [Nocardiopsis chromatogenes]|uniref:type II toxin-antitoxin system PemK/MazF family toxin n=1 Tax=Nocardiopsis chromatogenes TaxID=280239 RepID=UPI000346D1A3|nr:type II toxin-antitoxin system PemK/MazF family toxin [Nocardiopsis chromatogenes]